MTTKDQRQFLKTIFGHLVNTKRARLEFVIETPDEYRQFRELMTTLPRDVLVEDYVLNVDLDTFGAELIFDDRGVYRFIGRSDIAKEVFIEVPHCKELVLIGVSVVDPFSHRCCVIDDHLFLDGEDQGVVKTRSLLKKNRPLSQWRASRGGLCFSG